MLGYNNIINSNNYRETLRLTKELWRDAAFRYSICSDLIKSLRWDTKRIPPTGIEPILKSCADAPHRFSVKLARRKQFLPHTRTQCPSLQQKLAPALRGSYVCRMKMKTKIYLVPSDKMPSGQLAVCIGLTLSHWLGKSLNWLIANPFIGYWTLRRQGRILRK